MTIVQMQEVVVFFTGGVNILLYTYHGAVKVSIHSPPLNVHREVVQARASRAELAHTTQTLEWIQMQAAFPVNLAPLRQCQEQRLA